MTLIFHKDIKRLYKKVQIHFSYKYFLKRGGEISVLPFNEIAKYIFLLLTAVEIETEKFYKGWHKGVWGEQIVPPPAHSQEILTILLWYIFTEWQLKFCIKRLMLPPVKIPCYVNGHISSLFQNSTYTLKKKTILHINYYHFNLNL